MLSIDNMSTEQFAAWISKMNDNALCAFLEQKSYSYGRAMVDWLLFHNYDHEYSKLNDCLHTVEIKKIFDLELGVIGIENFSNHELLECYKIMFQESSVEDQKQLEEAIIKVKSRIKDHYIEKYGDAIAENQNESESAITKIKTKIEELDKNIIINTIMDYCYDLKMSNADISNLIWRNNFNAFDMLIELKARTNELFDEDYHELINGEFVYYPNDYAETVDENSFRIKDLMGKVVVFGTDEVYLMDNYYSDFELEEDVYDELLEIKMDVNDSRYKKYEKLRYS